MVFCFEKLIDNKITINNTLYYLTYLDKPINEYLGKYLYNKTTHSLYSYTKSNIFNSTVWFNTFSIMMIN